MAQLSLADYAHDAPPSTTVLAWKSLAEEASRRGIILFRWSLFPLPMPTWGPLKAGKAAENTWNSRLVEALHKVGVRSAEFERIYTVHKDGREVQSKPDISFSNGGVHVVSGKFGARKELEAYKSADEYKEILAPTLKRLGEKIGEVFAVTYPASKGEKFHLHVLPRGNHPEISLTLDTLDEVAGEMYTAVQGLIAELEKRQEPVLDEARRLLRWGAEDLAMTLKGVGLTELEQIFGGHTFFESVLRPRLKGEMRAYALRLGAAYLFVNQVLFYVLLSHEAARAGVEMKAQYPDIKPEHYASPKTLRDEYFERVRSKNYEPVYGFDVAQFFKGDSAEDACSSMVHGMVAFAPKLDVPDLMGQVFQTLIPLEIRKPLGAHYTNPRAAALLARLAIRSADDKLLDPACGSGTLLVAAYRRKRGLAGDVDLKALHHRFVEEDIMGIDAMGFVAHLAAVNLALQQPLTETDHVQIGTADSTSKFPGDLLSPTEAALPREFQQGNLQQTFGGKAGVKRKSRVVQVSTKEPRPIHLNKVDLVITNPPFTSWNNMARAYRESLNKTFANERAEYREVLYWKVSQQVHFLLLADRFLKQEGRLAAVLPLTTFTGHAFQPLVRFILGNYTIEYVVAGFGRSAYSEDTSLMECLVVARKTWPSAGSRFRLVATLRPPTRWTDDDVDAIAEAAESGTSVPNLVRVKEFKQEDLAPGGETLAGMLLRVNDAYDRALVSLTQVFGASSHSMVTIEDLMRRGVKINEVYHGDDRPLQVGPKALLACRTAERAVKDIDRLVYVSETSDVTTFRDRMSTQEFSFPKDQISVSLRRFSMLPTMDIGGATDFVVNTPGTSLTKTMSAFYTSREAKAFLARLRLRNAWRNIVRDYSARLNFAARLDIGASGTTLLACWSPKQVFLAGAYGYMIRGLSERVEKFLCLWLNSTLALCFLMSKATLTRGTWLKIEQYTMKQLPVPDFNEFSEADWGLVEQLWSTVSKEPLLSIVEQLERVSLVRATLDDQLLALVGVTDASERTVIATTLRSGLLATISSLQRSMAGEKGDVQGLGEQDEEGTE